MRDSLCGTNVGGWDGDSFRKIWAKCPVGVPKKKDCAQKLITCRESIGYALMSAHMLQRRGRRGLMITRYTARSELVCRTHCQPQMRLFPDTIEIPLHRLAQDLSRVSSNKVFPL